MNQAKAGPNKEYGEGKDLLHNVVHVRGSNQGLCGIVVGAHGSTHSIAFLVCGGEGPRASNPGTVGRHISGRVACGLLCRRRDGIKASGQLGCFALSSATSNPCALELYATASPNRIS